MVPVGGGGGAIFFMPKPSSAITYSAESMRITFSPSPEAIARTLTFASLAAARRGLAARRAGAFEVVLRAQSTYR